MAQILKGVDVAAAIDSRTSERLAGLKEAGICPTLAILRVGGRTDAVSYEQSAIKRCDAIGISWKNMVLPDDVTQDGLMAAVEDLNHDESVHGVLMLCPLPPQLDQTAVETVLDPAKDVDGITKGSLAAVFTGNGEGYAPCTASACMEILSHYGIDCRGKRAVVIGRSLVIGRPVAMMLVDADATVTICHTKTVDVPSVSRGANIVIVAAGRMEAIGKEYFTAGQTVIDVGIGWSKEKAKICGDVAFDEVEPLVAAITPVPGGVGSVTTSILVSHVVDAAAKKNKKA